MTGASRQIRRIASMTVAGVIVVLTSILLGQVLVGLLASTIDKGV